MKAIQNRIEGEENDEIFFEIDDCISYARRTIDLEKNFTTEESRDIMETCDSYRNKRGHVNWTQVVSQFIFVGNGKAPLIKLKHHYYNVNSRGARKETKAKRFRMEKLGLGV